MLSDKVSLSDKETQIAVFENVCSSYKKHLYVLEVSLITMKIITISNFVSLVVVA